MISEPSIPAQSLQVLTEQLEQSTREVKARLESYGGRLVLASHRAFGSLPQWAKQHIEITERLYHEAESRTERGLPTRTVKILSESADVIKEFGQEFDYSRFLHCIEPRGSFVDRNKLLSLHTSSSGSSQASSSSSSSSSSASTSVSIPSSRYQWYQNLGLLIEVYQRTENAELKKTIAFLANNYLAKAAPICPSDLLIPRKLQIKLYQMFQISLAEPGISYNRESNLFDEYLREGVSRELAKNSGNIMFFIDTKEIGENFSLWYSQIQTPKEEESAIGVWSQGIFSALQQHMARHPADFLEQFFDHPLLIDLSSMLEQEILTSGNPERESAFDGKVASIEDRLEQAIDLAVSQCATTAGDRERLKMFVMTNLTCVCRCQVRSVSVLKCLPVFSQSRFFTLKEGPSTLLGNNYDSYDALARCLQEIQAVKSKLDLENFLNGTGLRLGSVNGRQKIFDFLTFEEFISKLEAVPVKYDGEGENAIYFKEKLNLVNTRTFRRLEHLFHPDNVEGRQLLEAKPYIEVFGRPTLQLLRGLLTEIAEEAWIESNEDPDFRMIVQTTLSKINIHLMNAEMYLYDFSNFSQSIELIHYEIAALLKIFSPFHPGQFPEIYKNRLASIIPEELRGLVKVGLSKSAMNTFAGMSAALRRSNPNAVRAFHEGSHFEIVEFVGERFEVSKVVQDQSIKEVDFYLGEFNHNVRLLSSHDEYKPGDVIGDVTALLLAKPETQHLTVAVDTTIDFIDSPRAKEVLEHFSEEIREGRLNFIFFGSGQKFDLFGMDEYYGSRWYMINNGAPHWEPFNILSSNDAYQTDLLTTQWFCLVNKYSPQGMDVYRKAIFDNAKAILTQVPEILLPGGNPLIKVCKVAEGMEPCFLDIKCYGSQSQVLLKQLESRLYELFLEKNVKIHSRGGYGYFNPNINLFPQGLDRGSGVEYATMRLHPGINPEENALFVEFLQWAADLVSGPIET